MTNVTKRLKMLQGAVGPRPTPTAPPQTLLMYGVYDVPEPLATELLMQNKAIETTEPLGDPPATENTPAQPPRRSRGAA